MKDKDLKIRRKSVIDTARLSQSTLLTPKSKTVRTVSQSRVGSGDSRNGNAVTLNKSGIKKKAPVV